MTRYEKKECFNRGYGECSVNDLIEFAELAAHQAEKDAVVYAALAKCITDPFDAELINSIRLDKIKLLKYMVGLYYYLAKTDIQRLNTFAGKSSVNNSLEMGLKTKMFDEMEHIDFLRRMHSAFEDETIKDMMFEAILDGQTHVQMLVFLYNKYC